MKPKTVDHQGYTQCHLTKIDEKGRLWHYHAYVLSDIAIEGNEISLKNDDGTWEYDWTVYKAYTQQEWKTVLERGQDYKKTRKASDI